MKSPLQRHTSTPPSRLASFISFSVSRVNVLLRYFRDENQTLDFISGPVRCRSVVISPLALARPSTFRGTQRSITLVILSSRGTTCILFPFHFPGGSVENVPSHHVRCDRLSIKTGLPRLLGGELLNRDTAHRMMFCIMRFRWKHRAGVTHRGF